MTTPLPLRTVRSEWSFYKNSLTSTLTCWGFIFKKFVYNIFLYLCVNENI